MKQGRPGFLVATSLGVFTIRWSVSFVLTNLRNDSMKGCRCYGCSMARSENELGPRDPMHSLDQFVARVNKLNDVYQIERASSTSTTGMEIVSRGSIKSIPLHIYIQTVVYHALEVRQFVSVICKEDSVVDPRKLKKKFPNMDLQMISSDQDLIGICGFPKATLPPLGDLTITDIYQVVTIILDQTLVEECAENNLLLLGNAGYPLWKLLLSTDFILHQPNALSADVIDVSEAKEFSSFVDGEPSLTSHSIPISWKHWSTRPYFPVSGPPLALARLITQKDSLSNPFDAVSFTGVGRIGSIKARTKKALTCEFVPLSKVSSSSTSKMYQKQRDIDCEDNPPTNAGYCLLPWISALDDRPMMVELQFGKAFQGNIDVQGLHEGQLIQIQARTNPAERSSLQKWVDEHCLDVIVEDCQLLYTDPTGVPSRPSSDMGTNSDSESLSLASLSDLSFQVNIVDDADSLSLFAEHLEQQLGIGHENSPSFVGMDCEWQPSEFVSQKDQPQPVLLLQISFHNLQAVHLLDLQGLLRPLQSLDTPMNNMETKLSECLVALFRSEALVKVGYQLSSDLSRMTASYPHIPCFQQVNSVLEVASVVKKSLQISKQKKSRYITMSLASMILHYLGTSVDKNCQVSNWASRPLSPQQVEYAALDAAVIPVLVEKSLDSIGAYLVTLDIIDHEKGIRVTVPILERFDGDTRFSKEILSWRFLSLREREDDERIEKLEAKNMIGPFWIASLSWITGQSPAVFPC